MTMTETSTVIGVFTNRDQANRAIDELRRGSFSYDHIRIVERGAGSFLDNLKSLFTGQEITSSNKADDLIRMGVPEQDARNYQSELEAGRVIVIVKAAGQPEQAMTILRQNGAHDVNSRLRTAQPNVQPGAYNPNAQPGNYNPNVQPGTYDPNAQPGTYNPNVPPGTRNPNAPPETYNPNVPPGTRNPNVPPETSR